MLNDDELLRRYASQHSESAFAELVERHLGLVHSAALRQVGGDASLAQDVAQSVFIDLARKASRLTRHTSLTGWLYASVRFAAATARRASQRRCRHEQEAHAMNELSRTQPPEADWEQLRPVLDEAMHSLREPDRHAVLLRYFEGKTLAEVGRALGIDEDAARKRVQRALEKLRLSLGRQGVALPAAVLAGMLGGQAVAAAPAGLAALVTTASLSASATGAALPLLSILAMTKAKIITAIIVSGILTALVIQHQANARLRHQNQALSRSQGDLDRVRAENNRLRRSAADGTPADAQEREISRLRAEADALKKRAGETAQRRDQVPPASPGQPEVDPAVARVARAHLVHSVALGGALGGYIEDHHGQLPTNAVQLAPYMAQELAHAMKGGSMITNLEELTLALPSSQAEFGLDRFETLYQGRLKDLKATPLEGVIIMREKQARQTSDGAWERIYFDGLGNATVQSSPDGNFEKWEAIRLPRPNLKPAAASAQP